MLTNADKGSDAGAPTGKQPVLLIIDRDVFAVCQLCRIARKLGFACEVCGSLKEVRADVQQPAVVVVDWDDNAESAIEIMHTQPFGVCAEIIVTSLRQSSEDLREHLSHGRARFLCKPLDQDLMQSAISGVRGQEASPRRALAHVLEES